MNVKHKSLMLLANLAGFIVMITLNGLANALPINGVTTRELSDAYPNLFVPAGLTFSIWGLIYLLLLAFLIKQMVDVFNNKDTEYLDKIGWWFALSSLANAGWILAWHHRQVFLSVIIMLFLLKCLVSIYHNLDIGRSAAGRPVKYLVHLPFSVYLGWITIATIANITAWLVDIGWGRFGLSEEFWTACMIILGAGLTLLVLYTRYDIFFSLVILWAFAGIYIKRTSVGMEAFPVIVTTVLIATAIIAAAIVHQMTRGKWYH